MLSDDFTWTRVYINGSATNVFQDGFDHVTIRKQTQEEQLKVLQLGRRS